MRNAFFLVLFLCSAGAATAQTADEIIAKHIEIMGGDNWKKLQSVKMEAKVTAQNAPGMEIPLSMFIVRDKSLRMDVKVMGMTQVTVVNGDAGWMINPFMGNPDPQPLTADQVNAMKEMTDLDGALIGYQDKGYKIEYLGTEDVDGTPTHKLKIDKGDGRLEYNFIDRESFYVIKSIMIAQVDGKEVESSTLMSDFKTIDGVVFPGSIEQNNEMMGSSVTKMTTIEVNPTVDQTLFDMPAKK